MSATRGGSMLRPGRQYVRVLFDYQYQQTDGTEVAIKTGEECLIVKKSNDEWWYVCKKGDKKPIYVPANYVEEIKNVDLKDSIKKKGPAPLPPPKPKLKPKPSEEAEAIKELDDMFSFLDDTDTNGVEDSASSDDALNKTEKNSDCDKSSSGDLDSNIPPPDYDGAEEVGGSYVNLSEDNLDSNKNVRRSEQCYQNIGIINSQPDLPDYANLSEIQASIRGAKPPPQPREGEAPVKGSDRPEWDVYQMDNGKQYYYNKSTSQSVWMLPPLPVQSKNDRNSLISQKSTTSSVGIPAGWTEEEVQGKTVYTHDITRERWSSSTDEQGNKYFYNENTQITSWELPELSRNRLASDRLRPGGGGRQAGKQQRASWAPGDKVTSSRPVWANPANKLSPSIAEEEDPFPDKDGSSDSISDKTGSTMGSMESELDRHVPVSTANRNSTARQVITDKRGFLNKAKIMENGKKVNKKWSQSYAVLSETELNFYKDQKSAEKSSGKPEIMIVLQGADIRNKGQDKTSRKNVMTLTTNQQTAQFLIQSPNDKDDWYQWISNNIHSLPRRISSLSGALTTSSEELNTIDERRGTKKPKKGGTLERPGTPDSLDSPEKQSKLREWLNKWITKRPSASALHDKGIIKDVTFGSHLQLLYERDKTPVPKFVSACIHAIEHKDLNSGGIYRISGNLAQIQKLRLIVDSGSTYNLLESEWETNVLTGALKLFFRELHEPLFPFRLYDRFVTVIQMKDPFTRLKEIKDLIKQMPVPNRETLKALVFHLGKVVEHSSQNQMTDQNLAIVFGPTLLWQEDIRMGHSNMAVNMVHQGQIVELILLDRERIFQ